MPNFRETENNLYLEGEKLKVDVYLLFDPLTSHPILW